MKPHRRNKQFYGPFFLLLRFIWRVTHRRQPVYGLENIKVDAAVFIGRHQDMYGPVEIMAWMPLPLRLWALSCFADRRECYRQFSQYTFPVRKRWSRPLSKLAAAIISPLVEHLMKSIGAIPVYRGKKEIIETFRRSLDALKTGENLLVFPERDYTDESVDAGEMYMGFVQLARLYHRATGLGLHFYPIYTAREEGELYVEEPVIFNPDNDYRAERERIVRELRERLSQSTVHKELTDRQTNRFRA